MSENIKRGVISVKLNTKGGRYSLTRESDGFGDSGPMLNCLDLHGNIVSTGEIKIGHMVQCGSAWARSYADQDWVRTSVITEILEVNRTRTEVKVKTVNSIYTIKVF